MANGNDRLKVLFVAGWYPSEENPVAGVFIREHARAASLYDEVALMYVAPATKKLPGLICVSDQMEEGIRTLRAQYRRLPLAKTSSLLRLYSHWRLLRRLRRDGFSPDVIHAHVYFAGLPAALLGLFYRIPVIVTEHSSAFPLRTLRKVRLAAARFALSRAHLVLPVSEYLQSSIEFYGIRAKFRVVPNVVETRLFHPATPHQSLQNSSQKKRLLTVALLTSVKGIPCLLEAIYRLRQRRQDFVLDIVGDGPDRTEHEALSAKLGLDDVVHFHGLMPRCEVAEFMRRCDIFVLPSQLETFGVAAIEALASGKPVVASDVGGLRETVTEEVGHLVAPGDVDALAAALDDML
ncbi:MAG: glycosyltransferase, partial [Dehalococcoidia bacterium]